MLLTVDTWFDAFLVTLLAIVTALGVQRGLFGLIWGLSSVALAFLANMLLQGPELPALVALLLSGVVAVLVAKKFPHVHGEPWTKVAGGVGGFLVGAVLIAALTLSFPVKLGNAITGEQTVYPDETLSGPLKDLLEESELRPRLQGLMEQPSPLRTLLTPDLDRAALPAQPLPVGTPQ